MRHEMSLRGGIFNDAVDLFDTKLRCVDGQLELRDLDENTLFDLVEGGANGGTDRT